MSKYMINKNEVKLTVKLQIKMYAMTVMRLEIIECLKK